MCLWYSISLTFIFFDIIMRYFQKKSKYYEQLWLLSTRGSPIHSTSSVTASVKRSEFVKGGRVWLHSLTATDPNRLAGYYAWPGTKTTRKKKSTREMLCPGLNGHDGWWCSMKLIRSWPSSTPAIWIWAEVTRGRRLSYIWNWTGFCAASMKRSLLFGGITGDG